MKTLVLQSAPAPELARLLAKFESQFTYPLGAGRTFRISHGDDYPRFFRAMGESASMIVTDDDKVLGVLGIAVRHLLLPNGEEKSVVYIGDLKIDPAARKGFVYLRLALAAESWLAGRASAGFGVVMDGTSATPDAYTGRCGIPFARVLGKTLVWQFPCRPTASHARDNYRADTNAVRACYQQLSRGRFACPGADPLQRSEMTPVGLVIKNGAACGLVEDTRLCKRLIADDGTELRSAHLSFFAWRDPVDGARLIDTAIEHAACAGHPALFVAVPPKDARELEQALGPIEKVVAPATLFGAGVDDGLSWNINSSEI